MSQIHLLDFLMSLFFRFPDRESTEEPLVRFDFLSLSVRIIDDAVSVPEPSTVVLLVLGIAVIALRGGMSCRPVEESGDGRSDRKHWSHFAAASLLCFLPLLASAGCNADLESRVEGGSECLVIKTFRSSILLQKPVLVVFLNGAVSSGGPADYFYEHAERWARDLPGVVAVALLRPGYAARDGSESSGNNLQRRDVAWSKNVNSVANALEKLKSHHGAGKLVVVGHSSGAAYAGAILGKFPGIINAAILVSTPCDIELFYRANGLGNIPASESTLEYASKVPKNTQVVFLTGVNDRRTPTSLAKSCHQAFLANGVESSLHEVEGAGHNFDDKMYESPQFISAMKSMLTGQSIGKAGERSIH